MEWLRLLQQLPVTRTVLVLADLGRYARWLFRAIVHRGWHPLLRVNAGGRFRPQDGARGPGRSTFVPPPGRRGQGAGTAFKTNPLAGTLLVCWEPGQAERWLLVTDWPPAVSTAAWYGLRAWIEQGFKLTKRGGWQWQRTRMTDPGRAARLWLVVAVATLWLVSVGGVAEDALAPSTVLDVTALGGPQRRQRRATRLRLVSGFQRGWSTILVALRRQEPRPPGQLIPEPWPAPPSPLAAGAKHAFWKNLPLSALWFLRYAGGRSILAHTHQFRGLGDLSGKVASARTLALYFICKECGKCLRQRFPSPSYSR